jgi:6-phosphogluconolactonase
MKKLQLVTFLLILMSTLCGIYSYGQNYFLLVGTYPNSGQTEDLYVYKFNSSTGELSLKEHKTGIENPSYLAISNDNQHVYAVNEISKGEITSFNFDPVSGDLEILNKGSSGGNGPCYIAIDENDQYVFAGNYGSGSIAAIRLEEDGSLSNDIQVIQHEGSSINNSRQRGPHVHQTVLSPDNRYVFAPDLGTDKVACYRFDPGNTINPLALATPPFTEIDPGSGPRHFLFHTKKKIAYLVSELKGTITVFSQKEGELRFIETVSLLPPGYDGRIGAADIHLSSDGRFLYASNRGDANEIVIFSVARNGTLQTIGRQSTLGRTPRNFAIDPTSRFLLVANQDSGDIVVFRRDKKTGLLTDTGNKVHVTAPSCLKFVSPN